MKGMVLSLLRTAIVLAIAIGVAAYLLFQPTIEALQRNP